MQRISQALTILALYCALTSTAFAAGVETDIDITYEKFVLSNGLTLIVHEDHKAPVVALNIWYHVGSKNEKIDKTGFAHLFEHLMFNGSENCDEDFFMPLEKLGATNMNGTTNQDRTNYFETVPKSALDTVLWLESDRMGHLLGTLTQEKLDVQRGVVQNEKRQGQNKPYGRVWEVVSQNSWPQGHPYSWEVIGSMEHLNAASLDDVHEWFKTYYGAANAVLVIAGDVTPAEVKTKVEKYFGSIPSGPPLARHDAWVAKRTGSKRMEMQDRVPQSRFIKTWNVPQWGTADTDYLNLAAGVLAWGKTSRLHKRLVFDEQIATSVIAFSRAQEIAGQFMIMATAKPGEDLKRIEKIIDEEMKKFLAEGPTAKELDRIKMMEYSSFVRGVEKIGGFGGKSDILAESEVFGGSPDAFKASLKRIRNASAKQVHRTARKWLSNGDFILEIHPFPTYSTAEKDADRSTLPEADTPPAATFPAIEQATLSNGIKVYLAERHAVPVIDFSLSLRGGSSVESADKLGVAQLTLGMLAEGTKKRTALEIADEQDMLGADVSAGAAEEHCSIGLSALKINIDKSMDLWADVILNPAFSQESFDRERKQHLAGIERAKSDPNRIAGIQMMKHLFGADHPYGRPSEGTEETVKALTTSDLTAFHAAWFKPNNATLVIVGDTTLSEMQPRLEALFAGWEKGTVSLSTPKPVEARTKPAVYLVNIPGSPQAVVQAGVLAPARQADTSEATRLMNHIIGGAFTSRINMNLREDKHWTYGARTSVGGGLAQGQFVVSTGVQIDKAADSMKEIAKELRGFIGDNTATQEEFETGRQFRKLSLTGSWETGSAVAGSISDMLHHGFPLDYCATLSQRVSNLKMDEVQAAAKQIIQPENITWVIVGDLEKMEADIEKLNFGEIHKLDTEGNEL